MRSFAKIATLATAALAAGTAAKAAVLDFTDMSVFSLMSAEEARGSIEGVDFVLTGSAKRLTYNTGAGEAPGPVAGILAGQGDGIGLGSDEVSSRGYLTVMFNRQVKLTGVYLLDFYRAGSDEDAERVVVYNGTPPSSGAVVGEGQATQRGGPGFGFVGVSSNGQTFSFDAGAGNDQRGVGDFALAGLEFEVFAIPLPASSALLGSAVLAGAVVARRRRR